MDNTTPRPKRKTPARRSGRAAGKAVPDGLRQAQQGGQYGQDELHSAAGLSGRPYACRNTSAAGCDRSQNSARAFASAHRRLNLRSARRRAGVRLARERGVSWVIMRGLRWRAEWRLPWVAHAGKLGAGSGRSLRGLLVQLLVRARLGRRTNIHSWTASRVPGPISIGHSQPEDIGPHFLATDRTARGSFNDRTAVSRYPALFPLRHRRRLRAGPSGDH